MTNAEAWFNNFLRPRKPEGSLGRTAQDGHLDSHTAPELCSDRQCVYIYICKIKEAGLISHAQRGTFRFRNQRVFIVSCHAWKH